MAADTPTATSKRALLLYLGLIAAGVSLWLAFRDADLSKILTTLRDSKQWLAIPFLGVLFAFYWLKAMRWRQLLEPAVRTTTARLFGPVMAGYGANVILPLQLGEVIRAWLASRRLRLPVSTVFASIGLERLFDLLSLLALVACTLAAGLPVAENFRVAGLWIAAICVGIAVALFAYVVWTERFIAIAEFLLRPFTARIRTLVVVQLRHAASGLSALHDVSLVMRVLGSSFLQWALMSVGTWLSLLAMGLPVPPEAALVVMACTILAVTLPAGPGYLGSIQLAYVLALDPFGVDASSAIAASLFYHVLAYVSVFLGGLIVARNEGLDLRLLLAPLRGKELPDPPQS